MNNYVQAVQKTVVDLVLGGQWGDEGKGKMTNDLSQKNSYDLCGRFNGGPNAGHTIYLNIDGQRVKVVTHHIPTGFASVNGSRDGIESLIGGGCVIALTGRRSLINELLDILSKIKRPKEYATRLLKISYNAHVITSKHIQTDSRDSVIGTTGSGIGPTYAAKAERTTATRIENVMVREVLGLKVEHSPGHRGWLVLPEGLVLEVVDPVDFWVGRAIQKNNQNQYQVLLEAGQGFKLDLDWAKKYPYNTSSGCGTPAAANFGIPLSCFREISIVLKMIETYVGDWKGYQPQDPEQKNSLQMLSVLGHEFGATTGRPRETNWFNLKDYLRCQLIWSANRVLVNKCDILRDYLAGVKGDHDQVNWDQPRKLYYYDLDEKVQETDSLESFIKIIKDHTLPQVKKIQFSYSPDHI